jgi:EKC/KEOPS complex subunit CGI121/TPRKB
MAAPILTSLRLAHLPPPLAVHVALFREVSNAAFLRQQLLDGNPDFEYAFLDASSVRGPCGRRPA